MTRKLACVSVWALGLLAAACVTHPSAPASHAPSRAAVEVEGDGMETLATLRLTREVAMYYRLDLLRDNEQAMPMAKVMRTGEARVRACYSARLEDQPKLKGKVALTFKLSKTTGTMRQIRRAGGDLVDERLFRCIARELEGLTFNPPRDMRGRLLYTFDATEKVHR